MREQFESKFLKVCYHSSSKLYLIAIKAVITLLEVQRSSQKTKLEQADKI
jgi:hypothetical protein